ncbi:MAG TPA: C-type lectin domain-containing protein [Polyangiaceae bacterium]|nr:C-type lectin domain-containing protein [Polyangiaceae bacterium]
MNARLAGAALWAMTSCLPQSDDLAAYSSGGPPSAAAGSAGAAGNASAAASGAAGSQSASAGNAGSDGVVGGGSLPLDGMGGSSGAPANGGGAAGSVGGDGGSAGGASEPDAACADGVLSADGSRCYLVSSSGATWQDARDACRAEDAVLVKVETAEEDELLATLLTVNQWLGASDTDFENVFVWTDGSPLSFGNWGPNQPDRFPGPDCVEKRDTVGREWFDQPCDNERAFVCERELEP